MHSKGNYKQGEKTAFGMEENDSKGNNDKELISKMQAAHTTQYQESKQPSQKVGKEPEEKFLQRRHLDG